jgi:hypothetical protein
MEVTLSQNSVMCFLFMFKSSCVEKKFNKCKDTVTKPFNTFRRSSKLYIQGGEKLWLSIHKYNFAIARLLQSYLIKRRDSSVHAGVSSIIERRAELTRAFVTFLQLHFGG